MRHVFRIEGVHITHTFAACQEKPVVNKGARSVPVFASGRKIPAFFPDLNSLALQ
jgi:hypothetical protein